MLKITIPKTEFFDESSNTFLESDGITLKLEHSLASISEWESKWEKPFLTEKPHTQEEFLDYIRCMTLNEEVPEEVYLAIPVSVQNDIVTYMNKKMTATTINHQNAPTGKQIITAEIIYQWMIALNIPIECQYWHLNKLIMLIDVCNEKSKPPKKMSQSQIMKQNRALNRSRLSRR